VDKQTVVTPSWDTMWMFLLICGLFTVEWFYHRLARA
jgi:hypothetical protein